MNNKTYRLTVTAIMAALCYVVFTLIRIDVPTPVGTTSFHLGNVFCVLAALLIDGPAGGIAGAIGMGIGDLFSAIYVITVPKTIFLKFFIGYITGYVAHNIFHIKEETDKQLFKHTLISASAGMAFNIIGEPIVSYFYYDVILSNAEKALSYLNITKWITTSVNGVLTIIIATLIYIAIPSQLRNKQ